MPQGTATATGHELSRALNAIEQRHQHMRWHCWRSNTGALWATTTFCLEQDGSGTTVGGGNPAGGGAGSPEALEREIARTERQLDELANWWAA